MTAHNVSNFSERAFRLSSYQPIGKERVVLRASADSDVALYEAVLVAEKPGRLELRTKGPLTNGSFELTLVVDVEGATYYAVRTEDDAKASGRLGAIYRKHGIAVSDEQIRERILSRRSVRQRSPKIKISASDSDTSLESFPEDNSDNGPHEGDESGSCGPDVSVSDVTPTDRTPHRTDNICTGEGRVTVETWEPARQVLPVRHLTTTYAAANWTRNMESGTLGVSTNAASEFACWANEQTVIYTKWEKLSCIPTYNYWTTGFDYARIGSFRNWDFGLNQTWVSATSTASIQYNTQPIWGSGQLIDTGRFGELRGLGLLAEWEGWLISFRHYRCGGGMVSDLCSDGHYRT